MSDDKTYDWPVVGSVQNAWSTWNDGSLNVSDIDAALGLGAGVVSFVTKPLDQLFDGLAGQVVDIIIDKVGPIKDLFRNLTGDGDAIKSHVEQWKQYGASISTAQAHHAAVLNDLPSWEGANARSYAALGEMTNNLYTTAGTSANMISLILALGGNLVAKVQDAVLKAVKELVSSLLQKGAIALGTSWLSLGGSVAAFVALAAAEAWNMYHRVQRMISKLEAALKVLSERLSKAKAAFDAAKAILDAANGRISQAANALPAERPDWAKRVKRYAAPDPSGADQGTSAAGADGGGPGTGSTDPAGGGDPDGPDQDPTSRPDPGADRYRRDVAGLKKGAATAEKFKGQLTGAKDFIDQNTGYVYPTVPSDKPLMPEPPSAIDEVTKLKQSRRAVGPPDKGAHPH